MEHPQAVSGKSKDGRSWINRIYLKIQKNFFEQSNEIGRSDNLFGRLNLDDQNPIREVESSESSLSYSHVIEALKRSPEIDVSKVQVHLRGNTVLLQGKAESLKEERAMISIVENLKGVSVVQSELEIKN